MPKKKTRKIKKSKPKKTKKIARKPIKKAVRKPVRRAARKPTKKKTVKKKPAARRSLVVVKPAQAPMKLKTKALAVPKATEQRVGIVTHYYSHLSVAIIKLEQGFLQTGDSILIKGHTTDLKQRVESMQIEHLPIQRADAGQEFGLKVTDHVREHDVVYKAIG